MGSDGGHLQHNLGVTRRDLLRRGAIVGGTLLWATPVIQTVAPSAFARDVSPAEYHCCRCLNPEDPRLPATACKDGITSAGACLDVCKGDGYGAYNFHAGPNPFECGPDGCIQR
jgi:hypothetical protein